MFAFKHSAVSFGTPDMPPPDVGSSIGPISLHNAIGEQAENYNFAPTFVWVIWWVGLAFLTALVGNLWEVVNPWKILFEWADELSRRLLGAGLELHEPYPDGWGWNLFGTAGYEIRVGIVDAAFVWY